MRHATNRASSTDLSCGIDMSRVVDIDPVWILKRVMADHIESSIMVINRFQFKSDHK